MKTRAFVESMCHEGFITRTVEEAWEYLEGLAERSAEWESTSDRDHGGSRGSVRSIESAFENSALASITKRLETLEKQKSQTPQPVASLETTSLSCSICGGLDHFDEDCQFAQPIEQTNDVYPYQKPRNDPFSNTYNPGYRNHPNFSWSQGAQNQNQSQQYPRGVYPKPQGQSYQQAQTSHSGPTTNHPPVNDENAILRQSLELLTKQVGQLATQVGQMATQLSNREVGTFPSQPEVNPRHAPNQSNTKHVNNVDSKSNEHVNAVISYQRAKKIP